MIGLYVMGAVVLVMGAGLAVLGFRADERNRQFNARAVAAQGSVVGCKEHHSTSTSIHRRIYFPIVRYTSSTGDSLETTGPGQGEPLARGTQVQLLYDPDEPGQVSFTGARGSAGVARSLKLMGVVAALFGIAAIVAGALM